MQSTEPFALADIDLSTWEFWPRFTCAPDIELPSEPERLMSHFINRIKHMTCRFTPGPTIANDA